MSEALEDNPAIPLQDSSREAFKLFLDFTSTDVLPETLDVTLTHQLLIIARKYCFTRLTDLCEKRISQTLSSQNACSCCLEAHRAGDFELVSKCLQVIACSFSRTPLSEIAKLPLECMKLLVQADETTAGESAIFQACIAWAESRSQDIKSEMQCLLPLVRFQNMTPSQLMSCRAAYSLPKT